MVYQKKIATNGRTAQQTVPAPQRTVNLGGDMSDVAHDVTRLMELQGQLLLVDVSEMKQSLKLPLGMIVGGALCLLCSLPLLLVAAAQGLILLGLSNWAAYGLVGLGGILIGGLTAWQGARLINASVAVLDRSRVEFSKNLSWFKEILRQRSSKRCEMGE